MTDRARTALLFDVDTGIDDALAILLALGAPGVETVGIGTVAGNVDVDKATVNTLRVLEVAGRSDIPVFRGCEHPLIQRLYDASDVHGDDGMGNSGLPIPAKVASRVHAVDNMIQLARERPNELTLVALGPLTNVAVALRLEPRLPKLIRRLVIMGGAYAHPGNMSGLAEFNIWVDPDAAKAVIESGFDTTIVPLDATMQVLLTDEHLRSVGDGEIARFARSITREYMDLYEKHRGVRASAMHDPLATAIAIDPSIIIDGQHLPVTVEVDGTWTRGMTIADRRPGPPRENAPIGRAIVCFKPDASRFFSMLLTGLARPV